MGEILDRIKRLAVVQNDLVKKIHFLTDENARLRDMIDCHDTNSYLALVKENERLLSANRALKAQSGRIDKKPTSRKAGEQFFPWDDFPDVLQKATRMYLDSVKERDIQIYVEGATGIARPSGRPINARFTNGSPPEFLNAKVLDSGPTSWIELWQIGSTISKKGWQLMLMQSIGAYEKLSGGKARLPRGLLKMDPNDLLTEEQISLARRLYQEKTA